MQNQHKQAGRLEVGIIGAGKVGPILGAALANAGHKIVGFGAARSASRDRVEAILPHVFFGEVFQILEMADLIVVALPSDEIRPFVQGCADLNLWRSDHIVFHPSPDAGIEVLEPAGAQGAITLALHPAMIFSGMHLDLARMSTSYCAITAQLPFLPIAQALALEMGCEPIVVEQEQRGAYAEAIATATTYSRAIIAQSTDLLRTAGIGDPGMFVSNLLYSCVEQTLVTTQKADENISGVEDLGDDPYNKRL